MNKIVFLGNNFKILISLNNMLFLVAFMFCLSSATHIAVKNGTKYCLIMDANITGTVQYVKNDVS